MYRRVVSLKWTDVSEVHTSSIIRAIKSIPHGAISQKTVGSFMVAAVKADILSYKCLAPGLRLGAPGVSPQGDICFEVWRSPWSVARCSNNLSRHMTTLSLFYDAVLSALFTILGEFSDT
jgi:hypothetical protein